MENKRNGSQPTVRYVIVAEENYMVSDYVGHAMTGLAAYASSINDAFGVSKLSSLSNIMSAYTAVSKILLTYTFNG